MILNLRTKGTMCGHKNSFPMKTMIIKIENAVKAAWSRLDMGETQNQKTEAVSEKVLFQNSSKNT